MSDERGRGEAGGELRIRGGGGMGEWSCSASRSRWRVSWALVGT